jgi:phage baseplate assembly protein W
MTDIDLIKQDLLNRLYTRKGERVMLPAYGSIIWDRLFEPMTPAVRDEIVHDVRDNVRADPRLDAVNISVTEQSYGIGIDVELLYRPLNIIGQFTAAFDRRSLERK